MNKPPVPYQLLAIAFATLLVWIFLPGISRYATEMVGSIGGDNIKNYYTYVYQVLYPDGLMFPGMNYPYGEHIFFTDSQPLLSLPLGYIHTHFYHFTDRQAVGVMHWYIALSYIAGQYFIFRMLYAHRVNALLAIPFAALIIFLSPQLIKINTGHFALCIAAYLPMLIYWSYGFWHTGKRRYLCFLALLSFCMTLHHLYLGALLGMWWLLYCAGYLLFHKAPGKEKGVATVLYSLAVLVPVTGIQLWLKQTDTITDRPVNPLGAKEMFTQWADIVKSPYAPFWKKMVAAGFINSTPDISEGTAYLGLATMLLLVCMIVFTAYRFIGSDRTAVLTEEVKIWLLLVIGFLLISTSIPTTIFNGLLLRLMPALKQFRSFGRFSWVFYYLVSIGAVVWFSDVLRRQYQQGRKIIAAIVCLLCMSLWSIDVKGYVKSIKEHFETGQFNANFLFLQGRENWKSILRDRHLKPTDFQGILTLPYVHVGSEKMWIEEKGDWILTLGIVPAIELHLPLMDSKMSRTSWQQTFDQAKISGGPFAVKPSLRALKDNRPVLLLEMEGFTPDPDEAFLISNATPLGNYNQVNMYILSAATIVEAQQRITDSIRQQVITLREGDTCLGSNENPWLAQHTATAFPGADILDDRHHPASEERRDFVMSFPEGRLADSIRYELSGWVKITRDRFVSPKFILECQDNAGKVLSNMDVFVKTATDSHGLWMRAGKYFYTPAGTKKIHVSYKEEDETIHHFTGDILLRPAASTIVSRRNGQLFINNHLIYGTSHDAHQ